jgi:hypothetical protein
MCELDYEHNNKIKNFKEEFKFCLREKSCYVSSVSNFCHSRCWIRARAHKDKCNRSQTCTYHHSKLHQLLRKIERFKVKDQQQQQTESGATEYLDITNYSLI